MKNKNVGMLIPSLRNGGAERVLSNMSVAMDDSIKQHIIVWDGEGIDYEYKGELIDINVKNSDNLISNVKVLYDRVKKVKKLKKEKKIDTTISFLEGPNIVNILSKANDKVIISVHNFQSKEREGLYGFIFKTLIKLLYNKADKIVTVSKLIKQDLVQNFGIKEEKIEVIYNPYDMEKIAKLSLEEIDDEHKEIFEHPVVINAGRLTAQKGQDNLIKSFKEVKKEVANAKLVILGQGELEEELKNLAVELGLEKDVYFLGFQRNPFKYIQRADVFALSSNFEGFPMCLAESMACKTAVVSTDCKSGPREMLYKSCNINDNSKIVELADYGILTPAFETTEKAHKEFSKAIVTILKDEKLREKYEELGNVRVKDFDSKNILKQWYEII